MTLLARFSRLVHADIHAVLDSLEEPEVLLRQAIREMEVSIAQSQEESLRLSIQIDQNKLDINQLSEQIKAYNSEIDVCFEAGDERLSKAILRKKLEASRMHDYLITQLEESEIRYQRQSAWLETSHEQLDSLRRKAELLDTSQHSTEGSTSPNKPTVKNDLNRWTVSNEDVDIAFLHEKARRTTQGE